MKIRNIAIPLAAGTLALMGMRELLESGMLDTLYEPVNRILDYTFGKTNMIYEPIREGFFVVGVPAAVVSGLTSLVLD